MPQFNTLFWLLYHCTTVPLSGDYTPAVAAPLSLHEVHCWMQLCKSVSLSLGAATCAALLGGWPIVTPRPRGVCVCVGPIGMTR